MKERELSVCIWIHHIATFAAAAEGIYYLTVRKQKFWRKAGIFLLTAFQSWAAVKIVAGLINGRSGIQDSCERLEQLDGRQNEKRRILWTAVFLSSVFKLLPVPLLGHTRKRK